MTSLFVTALIVVGVGARAGPPELQSATVDAWQEYVRAADARMHARLDGGKPFLWLDTGDGYLWRVHSISRYEERDGGVYLEFEAIALSRDIPAALRWLVNPVVNHMSVNSLTTTLSQTREAVSKLQLGERQNALREHNGSN